MRVFPVRHGERFRDDKFLIAVDRLGQGAVFVGLRALRVPLDDRLAVDFGALHVVVARDEMDHVRAELFGELLDHFLFVIDLAAVADQAAEPDLATGGEFQDAFADVIGRVHGHHFAGADDIDFLGLAVADRHGEPAANHVAQHVVKHIIQAFVSS